MRALCLSLLLSLVVVVSAHGQNPATTTGTSSSIAVHRIELGASTSYLDTNDPFEGCASPHWTFGPEVTVNLNQQFAIDGQLQFLAGRSQCVNHFRGGRAVQG